jgi:hypothetical protein
VRAAIALSVLFTAGGAHAGATAPLVTVRVPVNQSVKALVRGKFAQTATCRRSCKVIARIFITAQVARKLHFKAVKTGTPYAVALKQVKLAGGKPTRLYMRLGREARKRLPKWKKALRLTGEMYAESVSTRARGQANWVTTLRP